MSKTDTFETDLLALFFNGTAITGLARDAASPVTALYLSLHTADPGEAGTQTTNEATYTGYARVAVNRTSGAGGFNVASGAVTLVSDATFPNCTAGSNTITHFGIGTQSSGAGYLLYKGALTSSLSVTTNVQPVLSNGQIVTEQ